MKKVLLFFAALPFVISCNGQEKVDLMKLQLNEPVETLVSNDEATQKFIGKDAVEYPFAVLVEEENPKRFTVAGIPVKGVYFLLPSEKNKQNHTFEGRIFKNQKQLKNNLNELKKLNVGNNIFGFRAVVSDKNSKTQIKQILTKLYGNGIKNPNTNNGIYWNVKNENKYIFFAPDYDRLIILNSTNLSKDCYYDTFNGMVSFGNTKCDVETYYKVMGAFF